MKSLMFPTVTLRRFASVFFSSSSWSLVGDVDVEMLNDTKTLAVSEELGIGVGADEGEGIGSLLGPGIGSVDGA